jgi:hypothetical protein
MVVPMMHIRVVRMRMFEWLVYMNVRVRFLTLPVICRGRVSGDTGCDTAARNTQPWNSDMTPTDCGL